MFSKAGRFFVIFAALIFGGAIASALIKGSAAINYQPVFSQVAPDPTINPARKRNWKPISLHKVGVLGGENQELINPAIIRTDRTGNVFIFDYGDLKLKRYDEDGSFVRSYGNGRGEGTGKFKNPTDFAIDRNGNIWVCDPVAEKITIFEGDTGKVIETIRHDRASVRINLMKGGNYAVLTEDRETYMFRIYGPNHKLISSFGQFLKDQERTEIVLGGFLASDSVSFTYVGSYTGLIVSYTAEGNLRYYTRTVAPPDPLPPVIRNASGTIHVDRDALYTSLGLSVVGGKVYNLGTVEDSSGERHRVIDVYSNQNGAYLYSLRLPEPAIRVYVSDDYLYTINGKVIAKWKGLG